MTRERVEALMGQCPGVCALRFSYHVERGLALSVIQSDGNARFWITETKVMNRNIANELSQQRVLTYIVECGIMTECRRVDLRAAVGDLTMKTRAISVAYYTMPRQMSRRRLLLLATAARLGCRPVWTC